MGKTIFTAAASGLIALLCGVLLGYALHHTMGPSPSQSASTRLEEQMTLAISSDNRQHPPQQQMESLALLVGQRVVEAALAYPDADALSRDRIQHNIERVLLAGVLERIPYADKRASSLAHANCVRNHPRDNQALQSCLRLTSSGTYAHNQEQLPAAKFG